MKAILIFYVFILPAALHGQATTAAVKKSTKKLYYYDIGGPPMGAECNTCSQDVYKRYGIGVKTKGSGCLTKTRKKRKIEKHNNETTKELLRLNGQAWLDQMNDELNKCCFFK